MNKQLQKYKRRLKSVEAKMAEIETRFPEVDFKNAALRSAFSGYIAMRKEAIYLSVDIRFCASDHRKEKCLNCNCWKNNAHT
jgi:hypothetical protein